MSKKTIADSSIAMACSRSWKWQLHSRQLWKASRRTAETKKRKKPTMFEDLGRPRKTLRFILPTLPKLLSNLSIHLWTPFWTGRNCSKMRVTARQEFWLDHFDFAIRFIKWSQQDDCAQKICEILFGIGIRYLLRIFVGIECPSFWSLSKSGSS